MLKMATGCKELITSNQPIVLRHLAYETVHNCLRSQCFQSVHIYPTDNLLCTPSAALDPF